MTVFRVSSPQLFQRGHGHAADGRRSPRPVSRGLDRRPSALCCCSRPANAAASEAGRHACPPRAANTGEHVRQQEQPHNIDWLTRRHSL